MRAVNSEMILHSEERKTKKICWPFLYSEAPRPSRNFSPKTTREYLYGSLSVQSTSSEKFIIAPKEQHHHTYLRMVVHHAPFHAHYCQRLHTHERFNSMPEWLSQSRPKKKKKVDKLAAGVRRWSMVSEPGSRSWQKECWEGFQIGLRENNKKRVITGFRQRRFRVVYSYSIADSVTILYLLYATYTATRPTVLPGPGTPLQPVHYDDSMTATLPFVLSSDIRDQQSPTFTAPFLYLTFGRFEFSDSVDPEKFTFCYYIHTRKGAARTR